MELQKLETVLEIQDLLVHLGGQDILKKINFSVKSGEFISIIGPNGAGKTTLLKCLCRILKFKSGQILLEGKNIHDYPQKDLARTVSYVPQNNNHLVPFCVYDYIMMGRYPYMSPFRSFQAEDITAVHEAMELTQTAKFSKRMISSLSGGERQRVNIAAALVQNAKILLLDEPATFLDPAQEVLVLALLKKIHVEKRVSILAVTHDVRHAVEMSDRVIALKNGEVVFFEGTDRLLEGSALQNIFDVPFIKLQHPDSKRPFVFPQQILS